MGGLLKVYPRREFELSWVYLVRFPSQQAGEKTQFDAEKRPPGLKPILISRDLRGPEGPLFHGDAHIWEFFSSLLNPSIGTGFRRVPLYTCKMFCSRRCHYLSARP